MKILIAEDNAFSRTLLKKTLTKAGYEVIAVESARRPGTCFSRTILPVWP